MFTQKLIFLDIETTGLHSYRGHKIVEIGCIAKENGITTQFHRIINPERGISDAAISLHKLNNYLVKDSPKFRDIADEFLQFIHGGILVGHNIKKYSIPFINHELCLANKPIIFNEYYDTLDMFRKKYPGRNSRLKDLGSNLKVEIMERNDGISYSALLEAQFISACYDKLLFKSKYNNQSHVN